MSRKGKGRTRFRGCHLAYLFSALGPRKDEAPSMELSRDRERAYLKKRADTRKGPCVFVWVHA